MTTFFLVRHGLNDSVGKVIAGRMPGVHLNAEGRAQAERLAERLGNLAVAAIYTSPLDRAQETAAPLARRLNLEVQVSPALSEIDYGEWTGRAVHELTVEPLWKQYNLLRSITRIPGGEIMLESQARVVGEMERLYAALPTGSIVLVSHGDVIRSALAYYAGIPLDLFQRMEINCASISVISLSDHGPRILRMNDTGDEW